MSKLIIYSLLYSGSECTRYLKHHWLLTRNDLLSFLIVYIFEKITEDMLNICAVVLCV